MGINAHAFNFVMWQAAHAPLGRVVTIGRTGGKRVVGPLAARVSISPAGPKALKRCTQSRSVWRSMPPILTARRAPCRCGPPTVAGSGLRPSSAWPAPEAPSAE